MSEPSYRRPTPWQVNSLLTWYATTALGAAGMLAAWWGTSGTAVVSDQIPWLNLGVGGAVLLATGNALWVMSGRRAVGERRRQVFAGVPLHAVALDRADQHTGANLLVAGSGMTRYHRPECQLVEGKVVSAATVEAHRCAGRSPCGVCAP